MKTLSVITPCLYEEANVREVYDCVRVVVAGLRGCRYEHIFIENATDNPVTILKSIAAEDRNVKLIINTRNFVPVRSPIHAVYQTSGDGVVGIVADLRDPPELLREMICEWERGTHVLAIKRSSEERSLMFWGAGEILRPCEPVLVHRDLLPYRKFGNGIRTIEGEVGRPWNS